MLSPVDGLGSVDPFQLMERDIPDFEKPEKKKSLEERLLDSYIEECSMKKDKNEPMKESYLLSKIVKEDNLSCLIVNLYAGNEGYSLMLKKADGTEVETVRLPYEENEFLDYLDMQQLPPLLVDVLDTAQVNIYHNGCVIVELRDYRRSIQKTFDTSFILLKPTSQTIVRDVNALMPDSSKWTNDDKMLLESKLTLLNNPRLCLDPSPEVFNATSKIHYYANKFNHKGLKRSIKRFSQPYLNRAMLCSNAPSPPCLKLLDFIQRHRDKRSVNTFHKLNKATQHTDMWKQRPSELKVPTKIDVQSFAKMHEQPKYTTDYTPEKIQEIILEGEKTNNRSYYCRVTIQRRGSTGEYIGDLYLEEDHSATHKEDKHVLAKDDAHKDGRACKFSLGNRLTAQRYLQQFQELYTEEGRKSVKISTYVANGQHKQQQQQQRHSTVSTHSSTTQAQSSRLYTTTATTTHSESTLTVNLSRTFAQAQNAQMLSQGNTYIIASSVPGLQQPLNIGSNVVMSLSNSGNATFSVSGSPYFVNASGNLQQALTTKTLQSSGNKLCANPMIGNESGVQFTTAYIQPIVSGSSSISVSSHGQLTAVPIAVQGNNVSIVPGNVNAQFIAKAAHQAIRPAGSNNQIMLQNVASAQLGQRVQASFAVPGNLVPISQVARVGMQQKGQLNSPGMASLMVHGKQVMVQGQATFIPSQGPIIPGLQSGQTAIIQGGSIFVQGQPGQSIVGGQPQGQAVMIQGQPGQTQGNQSALLQNQSLQGQAVFIQGQSGSQTPVVQGQTIMLQNQSGHQGQFQIISTSANSSGLQIVPQIHQKQGVTTTSQAARGPQATALSALTSQVNLIPVQQASQYQNVVHFSQQHQQPKSISQRRRSSNQSNINAAGGKKKAQIPNKPSPTG